MLNFLSRLLKKDWVLLLLSLLAIYLLVPQLKSFHASLHLLIHPIAKWLVLGLIASLFTFLAAALTYVCLCRRRLPYWQVVLVQLASNLINRLVPAGIGGLSTNYRYLKHSGAKAGEAAAIVAANNSLGALGHILLLLLALSFSSTTLKLIALPKWWPYLLLVLPLLAVISNLARRHLKKFSGAFIKQLGYYASHKKRSMLALFSQLLLTGCNVLALALCTRAVGSHANLVQALIVFSVGAGARNLTPTPGGLGGFEAGLVGGFLLFKIIPPDALAATLWFRLLTYWLPLVIGAPALLMARSYHLFDNR